MVSWESRSSWKWHGNVGLVGVAWECRPSWGWHGYLSQVGVACRERLIAI